MHIIDAELDSSIQDLLDPKVNRLQQGLQSLYFSEQCKYFYVLLTALATLTVIWILVAGAAVHNSWLFLALEVMVNICILADFGCKLYLKGIRNYFKSWTNTFDALVVGMCLFTFLVMFFTSSTSLIMLEEVIEEMFFVLWCSLQYLRIILFLKHQKEARESGQLIDIKDFHAASFKNNEDKLFIEDIEFNTSQKSTNETNGNDRNKSGKDTSKLKDKQSPTSKKFRLYSSFYLKLLA